MGFTTHYIDNRNYSLEEVLKIVNANNASTIRTVGGIINYAILFENTWPYCFAAGMFYSALNHLPKVKDSIINAVGIGSTISVAFSAILTLGFTALRMKTIDLILAPKDFDNYNSNYKFTGIEVTNFLNAFLENNYLSLKLDKTLPHEKMDKAYYIYEVQKLVNREYFFVSPITLDDDSYSLIGEHNAVLNAYKTDIAPKESLINVNIIEEYSLI